MSEEYDHEMYNKYSNSDSREIPKQNSVDLIWQLDSEPLIMSVMLMLKGYAYDITSREVKQVSKPRMTDEGILAVQTIFAPLIDKHAILGNLDVKLFNEICQDASLDLLELCFTDDDKYEISEGDRTIIFHALSSAINAIMTRALGGKDRETARAIMRLDISRNINENQKSNDGFWSGLRQKISSNREDD